MADPIDALKSLVNSEGWQEFCRYSKSQWSDEFVLSRIENAVNGIPAGDELSQTETTRNLLASRNAIMRLLAWPEDEIRRLSANQTPSGHLSPVDRFKRAVGR
ncbi:MAG TPA: hypothetical protein VNH18_32605 [Bryobacteraceae bacterium]|nr:hypothetical protein [Bryobacteraceae bacterium]